MASVPVYVSVAARTTFQAGTSLPTVTSTPTLFTNQGVLDAVAISAALQGITLYYSTSGAATPARKPVQLGLVTGPAYGAQLLVWGNSYPTAIAGTRTYPDRLRGVLNPSVFANFAVAARLAEDTCQYMYGTFTENRQGSAVDGIIKSVGAATFTAALALKTDGIALLEVVRNSAGYDGSTANGGSSAKARVSARNALHAMIALVRAGSGYYAANLGGSVIENTVLPGTLTVASGSPVVPWAGTQPRHVGRLVTGTLGIPANTYVGPSSIPGTSIRLSSSPNTQVDVNANASGSSVVVLGPKRTGSWTSETSTISSAGFRNYTTTNGDTTTYTINSRGGRCWFVTQSIDSTYTGRSGAAFTVVVTPIGGSALPTINATGNDQTRRTLGGFTSSTGYCQQAVDLGQLAAGWYTVTVTHNDANGTYLVDDSALVEHDQPMQVVIPKLGDVGPLGYANYVGAGVSASYTVDQVYNAIVDAELATWPADQSVVSWDPQAAGFDYNTHIGNADGAHIHLNSRGEDLYATGLAALISALPARAGLVRL